MDKKCKECVCKDCFSHEECCKECEGAIQGCEEYSQSDIYGGNEDENEIILTGKCQGCTHKAYDNTFNVFCLGCKRQWLPNRDHNFYENKPDLYNEGVLIP